MDLEDEDIEAQVELFRKHAKVETEHLTDGEGEIGALPESGGGLIQDIDAMNEQQDSLLDAVLGREP